MKEVFVVAKDFILLMILGVVLNIVIKMLSLQAKESVFEALINDKKIK